jgi:STE24 endopeptidase
LCAVVIEERHGFNKQTKSLFFTDLVKTVLLGLVLLPPLVGGFTWLLQRAGPWVPLQLWAFFFSVAVVMMTIYPTCKPAFAATKPPLQRRSRLRLAFLQFI